MRRLALLVAALLTAVVAPAAGALVDPGTGTSYENAKVVVPMLFPVVGPTSFHDNFLACRSGCARMHMGQDLMGPTMSPLVAAFDGVITSLKRESSPGAGNYVAITADRGPAAGWTAIYIHVNNDSPGTDDGRGPTTWAFPSGIAMGARVLAGQLVGWRGDSGNAEGTGPHLHFELRKGWGWGGTVYNAYPSLSAARRIAAPTPSGPHPDGSLLRHPTGLLFQVDGVAKRPVSATVLAANGLSVADAVPMTAAESLGYGTRGAVVPRDGTIGRNPSGQLWLVTGGARAAVSVEQLSALGRPNPRVWQLTEADLAPLPVLDAVPDSPLYPGALVRTEDSTVVQYIGADGSLQPVDVVAMASRGWTAADVAVLPASLPALRTDEVWHGPSLGIRNGALVVTRSGLVGVVSGGCFRRLYDSRMLKAYGYAGKPRLLVPTASVLAMPTAALTAR
jgi:hypothetical protein